MYTFVEYYMKYNIIFISYKYYKPLSLVYILTLCILEKQGKGMTETIVALFGLVLIPHV
jgi:hypothetical protein